MSGSNIVWYEVCIPIGYSIQRLTFHQTSYVKFSERTVILPCFLNDTSSVPSQLIYQNMR